MAKKRGATLYRVRKKKMETKTTYQLVATEGTNYSQDSGWDFAETTCAESDNYATRNEAIANKDSFITSLNVTKTDVYHIQLLTLGEESDIETICIVDGCENECKPQYMLCQYFGQYMIAKDRYELRYAPNCTLNELFTRSENSSFSWHPVNAFQTEQEAFDYVIHNNIILEKNNCFEWTNAYKELTEDEDDATA